ncbi:hypothetical protein MICRO80W_10095 [Micrococcus luteus]|nr:hypothetical protein MICRO80W_10095 [Micrococcus luteus]
MSEAFTVRSHGRARKPYHMIRPCQLRSTRCQTLTGPSTWKASKSLPHDSRLSNQIIFFRNPDPHHCRPRTR